MNKVLITGRLTKAPEIRQTKSGKAVCQFTVAVDDGYGDNKTTVFLKCEAWSRTAEFVSKYFAKGDPIEVEGRLSDDSYEKDGKKIRGLKLTVDKAGFTISKRIIDEPKENRFDEISEDAELPW